MEFLDDIIYSPNLLPAEHKAASQLLRLITKDADTPKVDLNQLLAPPSVNDVCFKVMVVFKHILFSSPFMSK